MAMTDLRNYRDQKLETVRKKLNTGIVVYCLVAAAMPALAAEKHEGGVQVPGSRAQCAASPGNRAPAAPSA